MLPTENANKSETVEALKYVVSGKEYILFRIRRPVNLQDSFHIAETTGDLSCTNLS